MRVLIELNGKVFHLEFGVCAWFRLVSGRLFRLIRLRHFDSVASH